GGESGQELPDAPAVGSSTSFSHADHGLLGIIVKPGCHCNSPRLGELCGITPGVVNHSSNPGFVAIEFDLPFVGDEDYLQLLVPDPAFLFGENLGDDLSQAEDFVAQAKVSAFYSRRVEYLLR